MYILLITIHVIACIVLIAVILLQAGRGGGLSEAFGGSSTSTIFGTSASTFLQKATSVCAILFLLTSLSLAVLSSRMSKSIMKLDKIKKALPAARREELPVEGPKERIPVEPAEEDTGAPAEKAPGAK